MKEVGIPQGMTSDMDNAPYKYHPYDYISDPAGDEAIHLQSVGYNIVQVSDTSTVAIHPIFAPQTTIHSVEVVDHYMNDAVLEITVDHHLTQQRAKYFILFEEMCAFDLGMTIARGIDSGKPTTEVLEGFLSSDVQKVLTQKVSN